MEAVWFIFGAFVGSIVTVFTMSLFLVNGRHRGMKFSGGAVNLERSAGVSFQELLNQAYEEIRNVRTLQEAERNGCGRYCRA